MRSHTPTPPPTADQVQLDDGFRQDRPAEPVTLRLHEGDRVWDLLPLPEGAASAAVTTVYPATSVTFVHRDRFDEAVFWIRRAGAVPELRIGAVAFSADRQWLQPLVAALDAPEHGLARAGHRRQGFRWDATGVSVLTWHGPELTWPVEARPAATGCPVQWGASQRCLARGGPYVQVSRDLFDVWESARQELVAELGCDVCRGRRARMKPSDPLHFPGQDPSKQLRQDPTPPA